MLTSDAIGLVHQRRSNYGLNNDASLDALCIVLLVATQGLDLHEHKLHLMHHRMNGLGERDCLAGAKQQLGCRPYPPGF